jgi:hypothetical protein
MNSSRIQAAQGAQAASRAPQLEGGASICQGRRKHYPDSPVFWVEHLKNTIFSEPEFIVVRFSEENIGEPKVNPSPRHETSVLGCLSPTRSISIECDAPLGYLPP